MRLFVVFFSLCSSLLYANKYLEVKSVKSEEDGSFSTSREYSFDVYEGMPALLSTDNVSVKVKVVSFDRNSIVWELAAQELPIPFFEGDQVLFQNYEHLLVRQQRFYSKKNIKRIVKERETLKEKVAERELSGYNVDIHLGSQLSSTYTLVSADDIESTMDFGINFSYYLPLSRGVYFAPGVGFSTGTLKTQTDSNSKTMTEITAEFVFQLKGDEKSETIPYVGIGMGVGVSSTSFSTVETEGHTISIPRLTAGLLVPLKDSDKGFSTELILDGVSIREEKDGVKNEANLVNLKFAVGYQSFF